MAQDKNSSETEIAQSPKPDSNLVLFHKKLRKIEKIHYLGAGIIVICFPLFVLLVKNQTNSSVGAEGLSQNVLGTDQASTDAIESASEANEFTGESESDSLSLPSVTGISSTRINTDVTSNPIVVENSKPGTTDWIITKTGNDAIGQIKGYANKNYVNLGETIDLKVSVNTAQTYTIKVFRIGWYQGLGGRLMATVGPLNGTKQRSCPVDATTGLIECNWATAYTLSIPSDWVSGNYLAVLTNSQGYGNYISFVVTDQARKADILLNNAINTSEAYSAWPDKAGGKSLYAGASSGANTISGGRQAVKVSFDRPFSNSGQKLTAYQVQFVRWIEKEGYDVSYSTDDYVHSNGAALLNYKAILLIGHDEYWTKQMRDNIEKARDSGVNLAFFSGNDVYWQVRYENSSSGVPNRVIVGYKEAATKDPYYSSSNASQRAQTTGLFRNYPENRPEQPLVGTMYGINLGTYTGNLTYVVQNSANWIYAGTGVKSGVKIPNVYGYEYNTIFSKYPKPKGTNYTILGNSLSGNLIGHSTIYTAPSGAMVFSAGAVDWGWALDNFKNYAKSDYTSVVIQRMTANILDKFIGKALPTPTPTPTVTPTPIVTQAPTITPTPTPEPGITTAALKATVKKPTPTPTKKK